MQIPSSIKTPHKPISTTPMTKSSVEAPSSTPTDKFTFGGNDLDFMTMGAVTGAVGVGGTAALAMGSAKAFLNGSPLLGSGLAVGTIAYGGSIGMASLMGAAMSTNSGSNVGFTSWMAGGAAGTAAAALAIF